MTEAKLRKWEQNESYEDWLGRVELIQLNQDRGRLRAAVNTAMSLCVLAPRS